jgi:hypothetical protein
MTRRPRPRLALLKPSPVLLSESADEFARLHDALKDQHRPDGVFEEFLVDEIADLMWEIRRYRRAKITIINAAYRDALEDLLERVCRDYEIDEDIKELVDKWFDNDQGAKQLVLENLAYFGLGEDAIEAEAMRIKAPDLEKFDRLLASLEWRLDKAMRSLAEFRGVLGPYLRATAERVIDGEVLAVGNASKKPLAAA